MPAQPRAPRTTFDSTGHQHTSHPRTLLNPGSIQDAFCSCLPSIAAHPRATLAEYLSSLLRLKFLWLELLWLGFLLLEFPWFLWLRFLWWGFSVVGIPVAGNRPHAARHPEPPASSRAFAVKVEGKRLPVSPDLICTTIFETMRFMTFTTF